MFIGTCIVVILEEWKTNLMSLSILFHLCAQHVSDINISIFRSLRLCCWIQQHSLRLLKMDILMSETCWAHKKWNKIASDIKLYFPDTWMTLSMIFLVIGHNKNKIQGLHAHGYGEISAEITPVAASRSQRPLAYATKQIWVQTPDTHPKKFSPHHHSIYMYRNL